MKKCIILAILKVKVKKLSFLKDDQKRGKMGQPVKNGTRYEKCTSDIGILSF